MEYHAHNNNTVLPCMCACLHVYDIWMCGLHMSVHALTGPMIRERVCFGTPMENIHEIAMFEQGYGSRIGIVIQFM